MNILALNPGSSSFKYAFYQFTAASADAGHRPEPVLRGSVENKSPTDAVNEIIAMAGAKAQIEVVGCRVVHGGSRFTKPELVDDGMLEELRRLRDLAPLHNPVDVVVLEQVAKSLPDVKLVAVFDTAFHQSLPPVAFTYALPAELAERHGLRRYGFHGLSHAYVSRRLLSRLDRPAEGTRLIVCHLGNGASVCALRDGKSVDTSMGFTPMEGLVMGARAGDLDSGLVLYLMRSAGMPADEVLHLLNYDSGLRGVSGTSGDVRALEEAAAGGDRRAELALSLFAYRVRKYIGAYAAVLEGVDAIALTGGIGEHSVAMRRRICGSLSFLGSHLDEESNRRADGREEARISTEDSASALWVIPTDEGWEIARSTRELPDRTASSSL